jgi:hypothetical protein
MSAPEELFPPKAGGMVDTARKRAQADQDQAAASLSGPEVEQSGYQAVRVRPEPPDAGIARTVTLSAANPVAQLLPRDESRRSAVILAVDNDVWFSYNQGTATDLAGTSGAGSAFYLPAGIGIPVLNTAQVWVSPTTLATSSRVSVSVDRDSTL